MKKKLLIPLLIILLFLIYVVRACSWFTPGTPGKKISPPTLSTIPVTGVTAETAVCGGDITNDGGESVWETGVCWGININPTKEAGNYTVSGYGLTGWFESNVTGLTMETTYHIRAYATNSSGTGYGEDVTFTTLKADPPAVTTVSLGSIGSSAVVMGGNVTNDGGALTKRGVCWNITPDPTADLSTKTRDTTGTGEYISIITGLAPATKYYARAYATNQAGTSYGASVTFTTILNVTDVAGNVYNTVNIGTQTWLMENLKTAKFKDGKNIAEVIDQPTWCHLTTAAFCWFNNDKEKYGKTFGGLYNWYAVNSKELCPAGWHVPSNSDWETLITYLGGESVAGGKMKIATTDPNLNGSYIADNSSLFSAFFGSLRDSTYGYSCTDQGCDPLCSDGRAYFWSADSSGVSQAWGFLLTPDSKSIFKVEYTKRDGFSVRCVKD